MIPQPTDQMIALYRLVRAAGMELVEVPALGDTFLLHGGEIATWSYIERHRPFIPPEWWLVSFASESEIPSALAWLKSKGFVEFGEPTDTRILVFDRRSNLRARFRAGEIPETLVVHFGGFPVETE